MESYSSSDIVSQFPDEPTLSDCGDNKRHLELVLLAREKAKEAVELIPTTGWSVSYF